MNNNRAFGTNRLDLTNDDISKMAIEAQMRKFLPDDPARDELEVELEMLSLSDEFEQAIQEDRKNIQKQIDAGIYSRLEALHESVRMMTIRIMLKLGLL